MDRVVGAETAVVGARRGEAGLARRSTPCRSRTRWRPCRPPSPKRGRSRRRTRTAGRGGCRGRRRRRPRCRGRRRFHCSPWCWRRTGRPRARGPPRADEAAAGAELLYAAVVAVSHVEIAGRLVDRDPLRVVEHSVCGAGDAGLATGGACLTHGGPVIDSTAPGADERLVRVELLDAVVHVVDDVDVAGAGIAARAVVDGDVTGRLELALGRAAAPRRRTRRSSRRERRRRRSRVRGRARSPAASAASPTARDP